MARSPKSSNGQSSTPRAWQRMLSGRRLNLLDPSPLDVEISDIAHGLARVARWNGQTVGPHAFSVAQHSLLVLEIADDIWRKAHRTPWPWERLCVLMHDAPEYVVGDLISPFKAAIGFDYKAFELRLLSAIHLRFGLPATLADDLNAHIKHADRQAAYFEATRLAGFLTDEAQQIFGKPTISTSLDRRLQALEPLPAETAQKVFLETFHGIDAAMPSR